MLLLLLLGASNDAPVPPADGVRAYASTAFSAVTGAATTQSSVVILSGALSSITNADNSEE